MFISELTEHGLKWTESLISKVFLFYYIFYYNGDSTLRARKMNIRSARAFGLKEEHKHLRPSYSKWWGLLPE